MITSLQPGFSAVVIGHTGGIGRAVHAALENDPACEVVLGYSRTSAVSLNYSDENTIKAAAEHAKAELDEVDVLFIATGVLKTDSGALPEKAFSQLDPTNMQDVMTANTIGPALTLKHFAKLLPRKQRSLTGLLSARVGSIGDNRLGGWMSYRASKAALNQIVRCAAIEVSRRSPESVIASLHPGTIPTDLSAGLAGDKYTHSPEDCALNLLRVLDKCTPDKSGSFFDYNGREIVW